MRGPSAKTLLRLGWDYPVWTPPEADPQDHTFVAEKARALPAEEALAYIAGKDPRPLLVLRECKVCNGTDDALLSRANVDNEKTFLLSRWFHCVKLPVDVLLEDNPFHNLFAKQNPEHMFMSSADGSTRIALESERSRTELWAAMMQVLKASYTKSPDGQIRKMEMVIDEFDVTDGRVAELEQRVGEILETEGRDSRKLKKAKDELEDAQKKREGLFQAIEDATAELKLRKLAEAGAGPAEKGL